MDDDIDAMLNEDDFAIPAVYDPDGVAISLSVIFHTDASQLSEGVEVTYVSDLNPLIEVKTSLVPDLSIEDVFLIDGSRYFVLDPRDDSEGITTVILQKEKT